MRDKNQSTWYAEKYNQVNSTAIPGSLPNRVLHSYLERGLDAKSFSMTLEIGANNGEHFEFVKHFYDEYVATDLSLSKTLIEKSNANPKLSTQVADVHALPFGDSTFDRVISTCVFHHLENPELAMSECLRVTKPGGLITIILPNDPGIMYRIARSLTTVREARKIGMQKEVQYVHAKEHRNHFPGLLCLAKVVFGNHAMKIRSFPLVIPNYNLNFITRIEVEKKA